MIIMVYRPKIAFEDSKLPPLIISEEDYNNMSDDARHFKFFKYDLHFWYDDEDDSEKGIKNKEYALYPIVDYYYLKPMWLKAEKETAIIKWVLTLFFILGCIYGIITAVRLC